MASAYGFVHYVAVLAEPNAIACARVGPTSDDTDFVFVSPDASVASDPYDAIVQGLLTAQAGRLSVKVNTPDNSGAINSVELSNGEIP